MSRENELAVKRITAQQAKIQALSEEKQILYYYRVIQDLGYDTDISIAEYKTATKEKGMLDAVEWVLDAHKKVLDWEKLFDIGDAFLSISTIIPGFASDIKTNSAHITGVVCGEEIDIHLSLSNIPFTEAKEDEFAMPIEVIYDVLNPIISKKLGKQFICLEPGDESTHCVVVDNERLEMVRANPYFAEEEYWKHFEGYRKTRYTY